MFLAHVLLAVCTCLCGAKYAKPTTRIPDTTEEEEATLLHPAEEDDIEQKIALIDIVFVDGSKRTCTGAIIHDNVVITAGHCFMGSEVNTPYKKPELTASFVVIGTQAKFETGYEQYLPIERVVTHPHIRGWDSDLALVHTFASMTANKIGAIMHLASETNAIHTDANLTVFSWGRVVEAAADDQFANPTMKPDDSDECFKSGFCGISGEKYRFKPGFAFADEHAMHMMGHRDILREAQDFRGQIPSDKERNEDTNEQKQSQQPELINSERTPLRNNVVRPLQYRTTPLDIPESYPLSNVLSTKMSYPLGHRFQKIQRGPSMPSMNSDTNNTGVNIAGGSRVLRASDRKAKVEKSKLDPSRKGLSGLRRKLNGRRPKMGVRSWRRQMGAMEVNKMSVEPFGLVNSRACKIMIDKVAPQIEIDIDNIICYANEDRYVTDADSGALAVRVGELVAITVGGIEVEGDHVAIGLRLSRYCPWIAENLPVGDSVLNCWGSHGNAYVTTEDERAARYHKIQQSKVQIYHHKNKYIDFGYG